MAKYTQHDARHLAAIEPVLRRSECPGRSGRGGLADEFWQRGDLWCAGRVEAVAEIVPEADAELGASLHQAEEGVAAFTSGLGPGSAGDLAPRELAADVVLGVVGVQGHIGTVQHHEEFVAVGMQPRQKPVRVGPGGGKAGARREQALEAS